MFSVRVDVVNLKFKLDETSKIVHYFEVMLVDRVEIISDYFSLVDLDPVFLIFHPLHFEVNLRVRQIADAVQVF